jgi:hypothetical protein
VIREPDSWKVDLRWWVAMLDMANAGPPAAGSPDHANPQPHACADCSRSWRSLAFRSAGADVGVLFAGAPPYREPSGVLEATAMEMPLVEVGPAEFYRMPSGRVVEGSIAVDRKVIVGQFGPVEMPFVLRRIGGAWRIEVEPCFALINR